MSPTLLVATATSRTGKKIIFDRGNDLLQNGMIRFLFRSYNFSFPYNFSISLTCGFTFEQGQGRVAL